MRIFANKKITRIRITNRITSRPGPSYYQTPVAKTPVHSPFQRKIPRKRSAKSVLISFRNGLIVILLITGLIYSQIVQPQPKLEINDTSYHPLQDYSLAAALDLKNLRNRSKLTFDEQGTTASLKRKFPEIDNVQIKLGLFSQIPTIKLQIAAPTFNLSSGGKLYVVGANGMVVAESASLPNATRLPSLVDETGFEVAPGKQVLGSHAVAFINALLAQCKQAGVQIQSLTLPASPSELDLRAANTVYFVKFDLGGDVLIQTGQYLAAKHKFDSEGNPPNLYLDVRVGGKIYYK